MLKKSYTFIMIQLSLRRIIRGAYFIVAAFNGYLVYKKLYPAYVIK